MAVLTKSGYMRYQHSNTGWSAGIGMIDGLLTTNENTTTDEAKQEVGVSLFDCHEHYIYPTTTANFIYTDNEVAQTFTPSTNHTINYVYYNGDQQGTVSGNISLTIQGTTNLVDSYASSNQNSDGIHRDHHPADVDYTSSSGNSFTCDTAQKITSAKFYLKKSGSPTGNAHAVLYAHSGTYGTSSLPTGAALATSDDFDVSTLTTSYQLIEFTFTGAEQYSMSASTYYVIQYENPQTGTINSTNYIMAGGDTTSPTHDGNYCYYRNGSWQYNAAYDRIFYVYGDGTDNLIPDGNDLVTPRTVAVSELGTTPVFNKFKFATGASLTASTTYAIVMYGAIGDSATNSVTWRKGTGGLSGGQAFKSTDAGESWSADGAYDMAFIEGADNHDDDYITKIEARINGYGDGNDEWWLGWDDDDSNAFNNVTSLGSQAWTDYYDISFYSADTADTNQPYTVYEKWLTTGAGVQNFYGAYKQGQTFTPSTTHTIDWVRIHLKKTGSPPDDMYCDIYATEGAEALEDSYSTIYHDSDMNMSANHPSATANYSSGSQSFTCGTKQKITTVRFHMKKVGLPTGNGVAKLYAHTGTYGTSSLPTGSALATSDTVDLSTLSTGFANVDFDFTGAEQYEMQASTEYVFVFENPSSGINTSNYVVMAMDGSSPTHSGNLGSYASSAWASHSGYDMCFYLYGLGGDLSPTGSPIASGKVTADYVETSFGWINIPLYDTVSLTASTIYAIIFSSPSSTSGNLYAVSVDQSGAYTGGNYIYYSGGWGENTAYDLSFAEGKNWWNWDDVRFTNNHLVDDDGNMEKGIYIIHNDISKGGISYIYAIDVRITYINISTGTTYQKDLSELIGLLDSAPSTELTFTKSISDQIGLLENYELKTALVKEDIIGLWENISKTTDLAPIADSIGLLDSAPTLNLKYIRALSDIIGLLQADPTFTAAIVKTDLLGLLDTAPALKASKAFNEIIGLLDAAPSLSIIYKKELAEIIGLLESDPTVEKLGETFEKELSDFLGLLETPSLSAGKVLSDSIGLLQSDPFFTASLALSDLIGLKETITTLLKTIFLSDSIGLKETLEHQTNKIIIDYIGLLENISQIVPHKQPSDQLGLLEDISEKQTAIIKTDQVGLLESDPTTEAKKAKEIAEIIGLLENLTEFKISILKTELLGLLETISKKPIMDYLNPISDQIGLLQSDPLTEAKIAKEISDSIGLLESIEYKVAIVLSDLVGLLESTPEFKASKVLTDILGLLESEDHAIIYRITLSDIIGLLEHITEFKTSKVFSEKIGLLENIEFKTSLVLTEIIGLIESIDLKTALLKQDYIGLKESITKTAKVDLSDIVGLTESLSTMVALVLTDYLGLTESEELQPNKVLVDKLGLVETILLQSHLVLTEIIGLKESIQKMKDMQLSDILGLLAFDPDVEIVAVDPVYYEKQIAEIIGLVETIIKKPEITLTDKIDLLEHVRPRIKQIKTHIMKATKYAEELRAAKSSNIIKDSKKDDEIQTGG